jgi:hypothetical protein
MTVGGLVTSEVDAGESGDQPGHMETTEVGQGDGVSVDMETYSAEESALDALFLGTPMNRDDVLLFISVATFALLAWDTFK